MTVFLFADNAATTLAGPIAPTATSLNLAAGTGALFPNPGSGQQFALTLVQQGDPSNLEIVYCTARSTDACTVIRAQEGTSPFAFSAGDYASNLLTSGTTAAFIQATQLQQQAGNYAVDTGSANAYAISRTPAPSSLASTIGEPIRVLITHSNTGVSTLADTSLGAATILNPNGAALFPNQIVGGGISTFVYDGSHYQLQGGGSAYPSFANVAVITSTSTFTYPNAPVISIELWGGGGGSGGASAGNAGSGGGGGGYVNKIYSGFTPGSTVTVTIGAGGSAGATNGGNGAQGGATYFGSVCFAYGGYGGPGNSTAGSLGGGGSGGDLIFGGQNGNGGSVISTSALMGGGGGSSPRGGQGQQFGITSPLGAFNGVAGVGPGGGATGSAATSGSAVNVAGAAGGPGAAVIRW